MFATKNNIKNKTDFWCYFKTESGEEVTKGVPKSGM